MSDKDETPVVIYNGAMYGAPDEAAPDGGAILWLCSMLFILAAVVIFCAVAFTVLQAVR